MKEREKERWREGEGRRRESEGPPCAGLPRGAPGRPPGGAWPSGPRRHPGWCVCPDAGGPAGPFGSRVSLGPAARELGRGDGERTRGGRGAAIWSGSGRRATTARWAPTRGTASSASKPTYGSGAQGRGSGVGGRSGPRFHSIKYLHVLNTCATSFQRLF